MITVFCLPIFILKFYTSLELSNMRNPMKIITASPGLNYNYLTQLKINKWPEEHPL